MTHLLTGISSMATRQVLAELAAAYAQRSGVQVRIESVGGVDAAKRVQAGEAFDIVVLAQDAMDKLVDAGRVVADSRCAIVDSAVALAVRAGAPVPDVGTEAALKQALLAAHTVGYSSGPSGTALLKLVERWGLTETLRGRLRQATPGVPVGQLVASGEVELGLQQLSELMGVPGITLLGGMPPGLEIVTTFVGAVASTSAQPDAARALLGFFCAAENAALKQRLGMEPPRG